MSRFDTYLLKEMDDAIRSLNFKMALKLFAHALKYVPDNKFIISKAVYGYLNLGLDKNALPYLDQHLKYFSDDFDELFLFATTLYGKGLRSEAMNYFNQAKKLKPENSRLALWLSDRDMNNEAVTLLNEQLKKDPENVTTLTDAIRMFSHLGDKEKARKYLSAIKRISPPVPEVKKLTGEIEENQGNLKVALAIYEEVISSDPKNLFIIRHLVAIYFRDKMWSKLIPHYRLALESYPNEPFLLEGLGKILISCPDTTLRNLDEGREYSERAFINFKSPYTTKISAGKNLATAYAMLGDLQNASKYINITINMAGKVNLSQEIIPYFENMRRRYKIPN
jgi:tetratricopeptide (TPR) repeat protein